MPEAVIVAAGRSPIGRARKGPLGDTHNPLFTQAETAAIAVGHPYGGGQGMAMIMERLS